jgi:MFS family permease
MKLLRFLDPRPNLTNQEISAGLRMMTWEGMASIGYTSITSSGFLAAYALALGADKFQIGILAALPFLMQLLQIPSIFLVEKVRRRKAITVISWSLAQLIWFPIALIPVFIAAPAAMAISALLFLMAIRGLINGVTNCSWNSWVRDLVPQKILGRFYSRRLALSTAVAAAFGLVAAFFVDYWSEYAGPENAIYGYTCILLFGALFLGMLSPIFMARMPEPAMPPVTKNRTPMWQNLILPIKDNNFRRLMEFLFFWSFALNLAVPFFAVYMLERLQMSLVVVISLSVLSQASNILFFKVWGSLADRSAAK